jgi:hypothetical protein
VRRLEEAGKRPIQEIAKDMGALVASLEQALNPTASTR